MSDPNQSRRDWTDAEKARAEVEILAAKVNNLQHRLAGLREAADLLWYCLRHKGRISASEIAEAVEEYTEARDIADSPNS